MAHLKNRMRHFYIFMNMKIGLLILVFIVGLSSVSVAQVLVDHSKFIVKSQLKHGFGKTRPTTYETDTSYLFQLRDSTKRPLDIYCSFDKSGNCKFQKTSFDCDSCYYKFFKETLEIKKFEWKQIGMGRYLSKYSRRLLLVGDDEKHYYTLTLLDMKEEDYEKLLDKSKSK